MQLADTAQAMDGVDLGHPVRDSDERTQPEGRTCASVRSGFSAVPAQIGSTAQLIAQVKHAVAVNHHVRIHEEVLRID